MPLDPGVRELAEGPNFAAFTTMLPSGLPMTHVMWVGCDAEHILINTEVHRQKFKNVERDPRVAVAIWDKDNAYRYAEVRGEVVEKLRGPEARESIDELSRKYTGRDYDGSVIQSERVVLKIRPIRQLNRGPRT